MAPWPFVPCPDGLGVTCISWCSSPFLKPLLVVGTMSGLVQIWLSDGTTEELGKWSKVLDLPVSIRFAVMRPRWFHLLYVVCAGRIRSAFVGGPIPSGNMSIRTRMKGCCQ
ncbi:unnamed protein product [Ectocarpus sp. 13 AM-2016]